MTPKLTPEGIKEAAKKELREKSGYDFESDFFTDEINTIVDECIEAGASHVLNNLWVMVEDGLPEYYEEVLVMLSDGSWFKGIRSESEGWVIMFKDGWDTEKTQGRKITHWMYIPPVK